MKQTAIFPGRYLQAEGAMGSLAEEVQRLGTNALVVAGGAAARTLVPRHLSAWRERIAVAVERFGGECSDEEIRRLTGTAQSQRCDVVVGMGGGKVTDTAKAVGHAVGARVAIVPTIASSDAPTSAVAVIYTSDGVFQRCLYLPRNPDLVLVDTRVIAEAPVRFLVAGMGDALATHFEAESCRLAYAPNECGGMGTLAGYALARLCYDTILEYGVAARMACQQKVVTPALAHVVEANTLLSGLGFESGGLAAAHSIHNGLTRLEATHAYLHGEKVAIGVLAGLFLTDQPGRVVREVYGFCESVGLPTTLKDIGLGEASDDDLRKVAEAACAERETIHHEPCPVSPDAVVAALRTADRFGQDRTDRLDRFSGAGTANARGR
ncbi:MAG: glycerol dehydrogenase [Pirellulales bacterium]|nr:glycerol dehydrogenase [Pirellulales bacterium]